MDIAAVAVVVVVDKLTVVENNVGLVISRSRVDEVRHKEQIVGCAVEEFAIDLQ